MPDQLADFFGDESIFGLLPLSQAINIIPNRYGRLNASGIFAVKPLTSRTVVIEMQNYILRLLPTQPVGGDPNRAAHGKRQAVSLRIPHIPMEDVIRPEDYAGVRAFGTASQYETLMGVMARYLEENRAKYEITWEHLKWGALRGVILDADGESVLHNLFTVFGVEQKTVAFAFSSDALDVPAKCREISRHIEDNLLGEVSDGVRAFVSPGFFDALISHKSVRELFLNHSAAMTLIGQDPRKGFSLHGIVFEEFLGKAPSSSGTMLNFIPAGEGLAIPTGTLNTFVTAVAPGDFLDTVNTPGLELYARSEPRKYNKGVDLYFESNVLPVCVRPRVLVRLDSDLP